MTDITTEVICKPLDDLLHTDPESCVKIDYALRHYFRLERFAYGESWIKARDNRTGRCNCSTCTERRKRYARALGIEEDDTVSYT